VIHRPGRGNRTRGAATFGDSLKPPLSRVSSSLSERARSIAPHREAQRSTGLVRRHSVLAAELFLGSCRTRRGIAASLRRGLPNSSRTYKFAAEPTQVGTAWDRIRRAWNGAVTQGRSGMHVNRAATFRRGSIFIEVVIGTLAVIGAVKTAVASIGCCSIASGGSSGASSEGSNASNASPIRSSSRSRGPLSQRPVF
jgi:hypothetical protein